MGKQRVKASGFYGSEHQETLAALTEEELARKRAFDHRAQRVLFWLTCFMGALGAFAVIGLTGTDRLEGGWAAFLLGALSLSTVGMAFSSITSEGLGQEADSLTPLAELWNDSCAEALALTQKSPKAALLRDHAVASGRQLRVFDLKAMRALAVDELSAEASKQQEMAAEQRRAICAQVHASKIEV